MTEFVGKRILYKVGSFPSPYEATVVEVSPSGEYVKLKLVGGDERWRCCLDISVVEVLDKGGCS